jgi:hypothetical protein
MAVTVLRLLERYAVPQPHKKQAGMKALILAFLGGVNLAIWIPWVLAEDPPAPAELPPGAAITVPDLDQLVAVRGAEDVFSMRAMLLDQAFGPGGLPTRLPSLVEPFSMGGFSGHRLAIPMSAEQQEALFLEPRLPSDKPSLVIYHAGHQQVAVVDGAWVVEQLLDAGFHVLALSMLPGDHHRFADLDRPLAPFLEHVAVGLNYALTQENFATVIMMGLSGGGWTTVLYAALDTRIDRSYPIAGSYPQYLREQLPNSVGDFEQQLPGLDVDYLELYLLASSEGREQIQIFSLNDPCCFSGGHANTYRDFVAKRAGGLGGRFDVVVEATDQHEVSPGLLRLLLAGR